LISCVNLFVVDYIWLGNIEYFHMKTEIKDLLLIP